MSHSHQVDTNKKKKCAKIYFSKNISKKQKVVTIFSTPLIIRRGLAASRKTLRVAAQPPRQLAYSTAVKLTEFQNDISSVTLFARRGAVLSAMAIINSLK